MSAYVVFRQTNGSDEIDSSSLALFTDKEQALFAAARMQETGIKARIFSEVEGRVVLSVTLEPVEPLKTLSAETAKLAATVAKDAKPHAPRLPVGKPVVAETTQLQKKIMAYLKTHPGARSEQMVGEFGLDAIALRRATGVLLEQKLLTRKGKARGVQYFTRK